MRFTVETADLRQALQSVVVHASPDDEAFRFYRVRVDVGPENVTVSATQGHTMGHALVSMVDNLDGELGAFDLGPVDVKEILALFRGKAGDGEQVGDTVRVEVTEKHLTVTDVSGLFEGKALQLPRFPMEENFPDVTRLIRTKLTAAPEATDRVVAAGKMLGLFMKAAAVYSEPLVLDMAGAGGALLVTCGESFVGMLAPLRQSDEDTAQINGWHLDWLGRIQDREPLPEVDESTVEG